MRNCWNYSQRSRPKSEKLYEKFSEWESNIYEWDFQHGTVERYDRSGIHTGEFDPKSGRRISEAVPGRRVEP